MSSSAILSDALSVLSKTTHQVLADVEARSRSEVARAVGDTNEARHQRDKALKDLHDSQLETEACRRESMVSKAAYAQAELTNEPQITHHLETLGQQVETIAQLRREVNQWKDQSKNWQDHFLRVEQERCALSSRIDELVSEHLMWTRSSSNAYTPRPRYHDGLNSTNGSANRGENVSSPTQSSPQKVALQTAKNDEDLTTASLKDSSSSKPVRKAAKTAGSNSKRGPQHNTSSGVDSPLTNIKASSSQPRQTDSARSANQQPTIRQTTLIRRVQAVVHVKREESDEEAEPKAESSVPRTVEEPKARRKRSRMIVEDPEESDNSDSDEQATVARNLHATKARNYEESDDGQESDEDELMMGNEGHREEVFGSSKPNRRQKRAGGPPSKKQKFVSPR